MYPRLRSCLLPLLLAAPLVLLLGACRESERIGDGLDGPVDVALLPPSIFYEVPVAFVTNFRSGRVAKLDLKRGGMLVEDSPAPWMQSGDLAFGADRALAELALVEGETSLDVWVSDEFRDELLRAPYITGLDAQNKPVWKRPSIGPVGYFDAEGHALAPAPELGYLRLQDGAASTDLWTLTWEGHSFSVRGEAAGLQSLAAIPGVPYQTDLGELSFTVMLGGLAPGVGSRVTVETDSGLEAKDAGGLVTDLLVSEDGNWVFAAVIPDEGDGWVSVWDAWTFEELERLDLPEGAQPERMALGATEGTVWVADSSDVDGAGRALRLDFVAGDLLSIATTEVPLPEPSFDLAEGRDPGFSRLFVASAYSDQVWVLDTQTGDLVDVNTSTQGVDPSRLGTIVSGITAAEDPVLSAELDEDGTRFARWGVFATTFAGELFWLDAATGCQVFGTPARATASVEGSLFADVGYESNPQMVHDSGSDRVITTNACGGVTRTQSWTVTFAAIDQAYEVEGTESGVQVHRAFEGERYVSDSGEISFLILPGTLPTTDGDSWTFSVDDGVTPVPLFELPGDPVVYTEIYDDRTGPWFEVKERPVAVVPHTANDTVLWIDIQGQGAGGLRLYQ